MSTRPLETPRLDGSCCKVTYFLIELHRPPLTPIPGKSPLGKRLMLASRTPDLERGPNIVVAIQKEMFGGHFFLNKMLIVSSTEVGRFMLPL